MPSPVKTRTVIEKTTTTYETKTSPYSTPTKREPEPKYTPAPLPKKTVLEDTPYPSKKPVGDEQIRFTAAPPLQHSVNDYSTPTKMTSPGGEDYHFNTPYQATPQGRVAEEGLDLQESLPPRPPAPIRIPEDDLHFEDSRYQGTGTASRKDESKAPVLQDLDSRKSEFIFTFVKGGCLSHSFVDVYIWGHG